MRFPIFIQLLMSVAWWPAWAVESGPYPVLRVIDGDTIVIRDGDAERHVRLLWVDTPERRARGQQPVMPEAGKATEHLTGLASTHGVAFLWSPGQTIESDRYGRWLAVVYPTAPLGDQRALDTEVSFNEDLIASGWSAYWRKYGGAPLDGPVDRRLAAAQVAAEASGAGVWTSNPTWIRNKSTERTAPRRSASHGEIPEEGAETSEGP
jgi:endonuclease YncB( thermonuclease family)